MRSRCFLVIPFSLVERRCGEDDVEGHTVDDYAAVRAQVYIGGNLVVLSADIAFERTQIYVFAQRVVICRLCIGGQQNVQVGPICGLKVVKAQDVGAIG